MPPPRCLIVVGAQAGVGRWLVDHLLGDLAWDRVTLIDVNESIHLSGSAFDNDQSVTTATLTTEAITNHTGSPVPIDDLNTLCVIAVPSDALGSVAALMAPHLAPDAVIVDCSTDRAAADVALQPLHAHHCVGLHPLFGTGAPNADGQTFIVCPSAADDSAHQWLARTIESAGGTVNIMDGAHHDLVMRYVQTATHQALLTFADVIGSSGLDLERDLWANRTPVFELLASLTTRVLAPGLDATVTAIQQADRHGVSIRAHDAARDRFATAIAAQDDSYLSALRNPFTGALFTKLQQASALATNAAQATRAAIAQHRRANDLIGVRSLTQPDRLHVGRIVKSTPTSFVVRDVLVGKLGEAVLLDDGPALVNARRLGVGGKVRDVEFQLGRVTVLSPIELDVELDRWLRTVTRGIKVLIPESINGRSVINLLANVASVSSAALVSDEVRLGQRECVIRLDVRADRDLDDVEREVQHQIDDVYLWPDGTVLPLVIDVARIGFLGPAGTFSDVAARQLRRVLANSGGQPGDAIERIEFVDFGQLVSGLVDHSVDLVVLPILSSSTGLVDLATAVLHDVADAVVAGGVIDVPVRFDAYGLHDVTPGDVVYSHPQGLRQCSSFIENHRLNAVECLSTAESCRRVAAEGRGLALAAPGVGSEFGLSVIHSSVGNLAGALTRFLVLGRRGAFGPSPRADVTLRTVWTIAPNSPVLSNDNVIGYSEVLRGPSGRAIVISTRPDALSQHDSARIIGTIPWSPRSPVVVA
jgi:prephenate dehydratase/prephenate dehydrogenase